MAAVVRRGVGSTCSGLDREKQSVDRHGLDVDQMG